jgi:catalase
MVYKQTKKQTIVTVGVEKGFTGSERDPRGLALKFYTGDGNRDLAGNKTPVFFVKDPKKFGDFIHTQKRDPWTNLKSLTMKWDLRSLNPESLHKVLFLMNDRGIPASYRHMHGFGSHTFSMKNADNERVCVKYHFKTQKGIQNFTGAEADYMKSKEIDQAQRDLVQSNDKGDFTRWTSYKQVMTGHEEEDFEFNPFDLTKIWSHSRFTLIEAGVMELNDNPSDYFAETGQSAFAPAQVVDQPGWFFSRVMSEQGPGGNGPAQISDGLIRG